MLARERASSAMDGKLRAIHAAWISAIPAEMTISANWLKHLYSQVLRWDSYLNLCTKTRNGIASIKHTEIRDSIGSISGLSQLA